MEGSSGTTDNLLIDNTVTLDCHRNKRNLSMAWVDVKKAYNSVDHKWLNEIVKVHRFPSRTCRVIRNLSACWNTRITANTKQGREIFGPIRFTKGLPQGGFPVPSPFYVKSKPCCLAAPASQGYHLSKPLETKVTWTSSRYLLRLRQGSTLFYELLELPCKTSDCNGTPKSVMSFMLEGESKLRIPQTLSLMRQPW